MPYSVKEVREKKATLLPDISKKSLEKSVLKTVEIFVHGLMSDTGSIKIREQKNTEAQHK